MFLRIDIAIHRKSLVTKQTIGAVYMVWPGTALGNLKCVRGLTSRAVDGRPSVDFRVGTVAILSCALLPTEAAVVTLVPWRGLYPIASQMVFETRGPLRMFDGISYVRSTVTTAQVPVPIDKFKFNLVSQSCDTNLYILSKCSNTIK
eukprot:SAG31_NODE_2965_length_4843_cov_7.944140_3_plen_147_part_00